MPYPYSAVSSDGKRVAYKSDTELVIMESETGRLVKRFTLPRGTGFLGGWSPDCRQLGFGGWNADDLMPCLIMDVDTGQAAKVAPRCLTLPGWSPDGKQIAFDLRLTTGTEIWLFDAAALRTLPTFQLSERPTGEETK
ncbi:MAG: hypothetical protein NTY19_20480 [Planctomycetota bacterium]|nr:hypothetical protein [Planctomycetota bacterium]